jgi:hypothetical protein
VLAGGFAARTDRASHATWVSSVVLKRRNVVRRLGFAAKRGEEYLVPGAKLFSLPTGRDSGSHFSRDVSRRSAVLSPTIRMVTPVTLPTISAWDG